MFTRVFAIILVLGLMILPQISYAIANGHIVAKDSAVAKSSVALSFTSVAGKAEYCSAVVVEQDVLITVGHCVANSDPKVLLGRVVQYKGSRTSSAESVAIEKIYHNTAFKDATDKQKKFREDIAIIHLKSPLPKEYVPVDMNLEGGKVASEIHTSGFGAQSETGKKVNMLDPGGAPENVELREKEAQVTAYDSTVYKIKQKNGGLCFGDSGGGAYNIESLTTDTPIVDGINISAGGDGYDCASDAFILRLSSKKDWINAQLEAINAKRPSKTAQGLSAKDESIAQ